MQVQRNVNPGGRRALIPALAIVLLVLTAASCLEQPVKVARLTILVTGDVEGYLKNCGCSGGQVGGEVRKARAIHMERENALKQLPTDKGLASEVILLDCGTFLEGKNEVYQLYSQGIVESMQLLDYGSVGLGYGELQFSTKDNRQSSQANLWELLGESGLPFTAANLRFVPPENGEDFSSQLNGIIQPYRIITTPSGFKVGVIHVLDTRLHDAEQKKIGVELTDMVGAVKAITDKHMKEADYWVMTIGSPAYNSVPPEGIARIDGLMQVFGYTLGNPLEAKNSTKALFPYFVSRPYSKAKSVSLSIVNFGNEGKVSIRSEQLALNPNIKEDLAVKKIADDLQPELEDLELQMTEERLRTTGPKPWYEGQDTCRNCHQEIYVYLLESRHMQAFSSLEHKEKQRSADCLPCHVTGHGTTSGWNIVNNDTPEFQNVTCESCHGPGEYHTAVMAQMMAGDEPSLPDGFSGNRRNAVGLLDVEPNDCRKCHDGLNSVGFSFEKYWPKIDHTTAGMAAAKSSQTSVEDEENGDGHDH